MRITRVFPLSKRPKRHCPISMRHTPIFFYSITYMIKLQLKISDLVDERDTYRFFKRHRHNLDFVDTDCDISNNKALPLHVEAHPSTTRLSLR